MVRQCQLFGEVEAYAAAVGGIASLHEPGEERGLTVFGHSHAGVLHTDDELSVGQLHPHGDVSFSWGILEGVAEQVVDNLVEAAAVYEHGVVLGERHEEQVHLAVLRKVAEGHGDVAQEADDVGLLQAQREFAALQLVHLEQLVDEPHHAVGATPHVAHGLTQVGGQLTGFPHAVHRPLYEGERRAELMAEVHEELLLEVADLTLHANVVAHGVGDEQQPDDVPGNEAHYCEIDEPRPPGVPPWLPDDHLHGSLFPWVLAHDAHMEHVGAGLQVLVHRLVLAGGLAPCPVYPLEHILILGVVGEVEHHIRETESE